MGHGGGTGASEKRAPRGAPFAPSPPRPRCFRIIRGSRACYDAGFKANVVCIVPDFLTVTLMVNVGQGVAYYLHPSPRYGVSIAPHVACIPFADPTMGWHYYQARRRCP